jgi:hypothetical protein
VANLYGKNCNPDILNPEQERKVYVDTVTTLKRDHIFIGNESAEAIQALLDPLFFELIPRSCNSPKLSLKKIDHGELNGLNNDDHEQYVHISIDREISANHTFTGNLIFGGQSYFTAGIRDVEGYLGDNLEVLSSGGGGRPIWKSPNDLRIDHNFLINLDSDDHLQYVHVSENREISADHLFTGDIDVSGSIEVSGILKDSGGNSPTKGQIPIADDTGRFQWRTPVIENVYWVAKDGDDANDGLTPQSAKASIKSAVRASYSGDLGKVLDAAESIFANKALIKDETINELYTRNFALPNLTIYDQKAREVYKILLSNRVSVIAEAIGEVSALFPGSVSDINGKCTRDSKLLILSIARDLFYGGFSNSYEFTSAYFNVNGDFISSIFSPAPEKSLTVQIFNAIKDKLKALIPGPEFSHFRTRIDRLFGYVGDSIQNESLSFFPTVKEQEDLKEAIYYNLRNLVDDVWANMLSIYDEEILSPTEEKCKRDIELIAIAIAEDIGNWGTSRISEATQFYIDGTTIFDPDIERIASIFAYDNLRSRIRNLTSNNPIKAKVDSLFSILTNALNNLATASIGDVDEGTQINKSAKLCNRDLGYFIDAVASDMKNGGNVFSIEFAEKYYEGNTLIHISGQLEDTIWAFNRARELMILAMKNWRVNPAGDLYQTEYTIKKIFIDNSIVFDEWPACANAETAINNYYQIIEFILENGPNATAKNAQRLIYESIGKGDDPTSIINSVWNDTIAEYPLVEFTEGKCKRDLNLVIEAIAKDIYSEGNSNTIAATRSYFPTSGNPIETQIEESIFAYNTARDYINNNLLIGIEYASVRAQVTTLINILTTALDNNSLEFLPEEDIGNWTLQQPSFKTTIFVNSGVYNEENPIDLPPNTVVTGNSLRGITVNAVNRTLDLFHVNNACGLSFMTFSNHLAPSYAVSFAKKNGQGTAGIISRSPYVQQCTSITTTGGGMLVDGAITEGVKSMVLDSYTQYNQGGPGVKIINNGYAQLVSLFTISCSTGIECATGGQCDLTNSNSSFGDYGLVADGLGEKEIVAKVLDNVETGSLTFRVEIPETLRPYNGQAGYFGAPFFTIQDIKIIDPGSGYEAPPNITISLPEGPNPIPARARVAIENGSLSEVTLVKSGTSYVSTPSIQVSYPTLPGGTLPTLEVVMAPLLYTVVSSSEVESDNSTTVTLVTPTLYPIAKGSSFVLSRQSKVLASGHSFEYIGAGPNIQAALPINNGTFIQQQEIEERNGGSVIFTSTDQSGNFRIGDGVIIDQTSGTIGGISFSRGLFAQITPLILALQ